MLLSNVFEVKTPKNLPAKYLVVSLIVGLASQNISAAGKSTDGLNWPKPWALVYAKNAEGRVQMAPVPESIAKSENFEDFNSAQAELMHREKALISPEYMMHIQSSYDDESPPIREIALGTQFYTSAADAFNSPTPDLENAKWIQLIYAKDGLTPQELAAIRNDYRQNDIPKQKPVTRWFQIYDGELTVGRTAGRTYGCGDVWQDGIKSSELACSDNKTYFLCQIEAYKKNVDPKVVYTPGPCGEPAGEKPVEAPGGNPVEPAFPDLDNILKTLRENPHFTINSTQVWTEEAPQTETFNMVVLVDSDSKWNKDTVVHDQLAKTSKIFNSCGVSAQKVLVVNITFTAAGLAVVSNERPNPSLGPAEIPIGKAGLPKTIMTGFLLKNRTKERDVAYAFNRASVDRAPSFGQDWSSLLYSYWVSDQYITSNNDPQYLESYSTIAHELTHILGNLGHTDQRPNLMSNSDKRASKSGDLNAEQCAEIKKNMIR